MKKSGVRRGVLVYKGPDPAGKMEIPVYTGFQSRFAFPSLVIAMSASPPSGFV